MSQKVFTGRGTVTKFGPVTATAQAYPNTLPVLKTIGFSGITIKTEDTTNMDSVGAFEEFIATTANSGEITLTGFKVPGDPGPTAFRVLTTGLGLIALSVQCPIAGSQTTTGDLYTLVGVVTELQEADLSYEKATTWMAKIKINGVTAYTPGA